MNPSGRAKLSVPYRSPDGEHCSLGCGWIIHPFSIACRRKCRLYGVALEDEVGRPIRCRSCKRHDSRRGRPTIVCLCGSTRFYAAFQEAYFRETMQQRIVLSVGFFPDMKDGEHGEERGISPNQKFYLDRLHMAKIDMADEVLVINVGGYVGESTAREIEHARSRGKTVRWLEARR